MLQTPTLKDALLLCVFAIVITLQPFFLHREILMMETGIHLPVINAVLNGEVLYRDVFFLRGPLELYIPTLMMNWLGANMAALPLFYYIGTVLALFACIFIGKNLYTSRLTLYLMVPVFIGRTFPRVSYNYWGGMRYALGLAALLCLIIFLKNQRKRWIIATGIISALALLTTVESGLCAIIAVVCALVLSLFIQKQKFKHVLKTAGDYFIGMAIIIVPYFLYLLSTGSLLAFIDTHYTVATNMLGTFIAPPGNAPETITQFLGGLWPSSRYFKFMTPVFCYLFLLGYLIYQWKNKTWKWETTAISTIAVYGIILYIGSFRLIEGHHFEMALQPEKILLFFLLERFVFFMRGKAGHGKKKAIKGLYYFVIFAFIGSSIGYAIQRYNHRFVAFKIVRNKVFNRQEDLRPLKGREVQTLNFTRAYGLTVPSWQADELEAVTRFLIDHTRAGEVVFTYPELGNFNFLADRPFVGRFPIATAAWFKEDWVKEYTQELKSLRPKYVVMTKLGHPTFPADWYFRNPKNEQYFNEMTGYILKNYSRIKSYQTVEIYKLKR